MLENAMQPLDFNMIEIAIQPLDFNMLEITFLFNWIESTNMLLGEFELEYMVEILLLPF